MRVRVVGDNVRIEITRRQFDTLQFVLWFYGCCNETPSKEGYVGVTDVKSLWNELVELRGQAQRRQR